MLERLQRLVRDLAGRNDARLVALLVGQIEAAEDGVALARRVADGDLDPAAARPVMEDVEARGDEQRREVVVELARVLAPPIDREDLFRFSRSIDDVLDNLLDLLHEMELFGVASDPLLVEPLDGVGDGLARLRAGVEALVDEPGDARVRTREAKQNDVRLAYQRAVADLLDDDGPVTATTTKRRLLLRRVDVVGLRLGEAADALADGTVKRD